MEIGELAEAAGVTRRTIRYYTSLGLLPPGQPDGARRLYGPEHLERLRLIRAMTDDFLPLDEIRRRLTEVPPAATMVAEASADYGLLKSAPRKHYKQRPLAPRPPQDEPEERVCYAPPERSQEFELLADLRFREPSPVLWRRVALRPWLEVHVRTDAPGEVDEVLARIRAALDDV